MNRKKMAKLPVNQEIEIELDQRTIRESASALRAKDL
jgi:hypothetical protein